MCEIAWRDDQLLVSCMELWEELPRLLLHGCMYSLEARLIGSSGIRTHDLSIVRRTRCHLSYRASVVNCLFKDESFLFHVPLIVFPSVKNVPGSCTNYKSLVSNSSSLKQILVLILRTISDEVEGFVNWVPVAGYKPQATQRLAI